MRAIRKPENAGLDYRGGARVSDGGEDEDFFIFGSGAMQAQPALQAAEQKKNDVIPAKAGIHFDPGLPVPKQMDSRFRGNDGW